MNREISSRFSNLVGILCVVGAMTIFMTMDMLIKLLSADYPLHEIMFIRSVVATVIILVIFSPFEGGVGAMRTNKWGIHLLRALGIFISNIAFYLSIASMPLAEATAIFFIAPLLITVLSSLFLNEHVGIRRWLGVIVGLGGVAAIIRPGTEIFQFASILPLIAALAYAAVQVSTRRLGKTEKAATMAFYTQASFIIICGLIGLGVGNGRFEGGAHPSLDFLFRLWTVPTSNDLLLMALIGLLMGLGIYLIFYGYRTSEASLIAPFEYVGIPISVFWSILIFRDFPNGIAWFGISLIIASGFYTAYRESIDSKKRPEAFIKPPA